MIVEATLHGSGVHRDRLGRFSAEKPEVPDSPQAQAEPTIKPAGGERDGFQALAAMVQRLHDEAGRVVVLVRLVQCFSVECQELRKREARGAFCNSFRRPGLCCSSHARSARLPELSRESRNWAGLPLETEVHAKDHAYASAREKDTSASQHSHNFSRHTTDTCAGAESKNQQSNTRKFMKVCTWHCLHLFMRGKEISRQAPFASASTLVGVLKLEVSNLHADLDLKVQGPEWHQILPLPGSTALQGRPMRRARPGRLQ